MVVKDLNEILDRCGFKFIDEKPILVPGSSQVFLQMVHEAIKNEPKPEKFEEWTNDTANIAKAIRYLAIAIYLLENEE